MELTNFGAARREMVRHRVLDHLEQLHRPAPLCGDAQLVEQLHCSERDSPHQTHETTEPAVDARNSRLWVYFNKHILRCMNVHLQQARFVERAVKEHEKTLLISPRHKARAQQIDSYLMCNIGAKVHGISFAFLQYVCMVGRVQQLISFANLYMRKSHTQ